MVSLATITYWCYITAILVFGVESLGFIFDPPRMISVASDSYAQFFIRITGICLLPVTQFFWSFRHVSFTDSTLGSYSLGCGRLFAKLHTLISLLLCYVMYHQGVNIPNGQCLLGMHVTWALVMAYALTQHHPNVHGYIIDTSSVPAAAKNFKQLVQGDDDEPRTVLHMIKGEDSSSRSVMQMFQDEVKTD